MGRNYWMFVESWENFEISRELGFTLHGVGGKYRKRAQRMQPDDRVLYYVSGVRKWAATATIVSHCFRDSTAIWKSSGTVDEFAYRVELVPDIELNQEDFIDAMILAPRLEYIKRWRPEHWPLAFRGSLHLLPQRDFRLIEREMKRNVSGKSGVLGQRECQGPKEFVPGFNTSSAQDVRAG